MMNFPYKSKIRTLQNAQYQLSKKYILFIIFSASVLSSFGHRVIEPSSINMHSIFRVHVDLIIFVALIFIYQSTQLLYSSLPNLSNSLYYTNQLSLPVSVEHSRKVNAVFFLCIRCICPFLKHSQSSKRTNV